MQEIRDVSNNSRILKCCKNYQHKTSGLLVLLTSDVQLSCVATSSRVHSLNRKVNKYEMDYQ